MSSVSQLVVTVIQESLEGPQTSYLRCWLKLRMICVLQHTKLRGPFSSTESISTPSLGIGGQNPESFALHGHVRGNLICVLFPWSKESNRLEAIRRDAWGNRRVRQQRFLRERRWRAGALSKLPKHRALPRSHSVCEKPRPPPPSPLTMTRGGEEEGKRPHLRGGRHLTLETVPDRARGTLPETGGSSPACPHGPQAVTRLFLPVPFRPVASRLRGKAGAGRGGWCGEGGRWAVRGAVDAQDGRCRSGSGAAAGDGGAAPGPACTTGGAAAAAGLCGSPGVPELRGPVGAARSPARVVSALPPPRGAGNNRAGELCPPCRERRRRGGRWDEMISGGAFYF